MRVRYQKKCHGSCVWKGRLKETGRMMWKAQVTCREPGLGKSPGTVGEWVGVTHGWGNTCVEGSSLEDQELGLC